MRVFSLTMVGTLIGCDGPPTRSAGAEADSPLSGCTGDCLISVSVVGLVGSPNSSSGQVGLIDGMKVGEPGWFAAGLSDLPTVVRGHVGALVGAKLVGAAVVEGTLGSSEGEDVSLGDVVLGTLSAVGPFGGVRNAFVGVGILDSAVEGSKDRSVGTFVG